MIKIVLVQDDKFRIRAVVLGVTGSARLGLHLSMKSGMRLHIGARFLVTIQTPLVLPRLVKLDVALGAIFLPFGMRFCKFSRRHNRLYSLCCNPRHLQTKKNQCDDSRQTSPGNESWHGVHPK